MGSRVRQHSFFKLDQNPGGRGLRCDDDGLFLGRVPLLQRDGRGHFEARPVTELQKILHRAYGADTNWQSCARSAELVAKALNKGEMARAMMTAVLMRLPEPDDLNDALTKAGFNPDEPRDEKGRWTTDGNGATHDADVPDITARIQLAQDGDSDASDDPVAQAATRAAALSAQRNHGSGTSRGKPGASVAPTTSWIARYRNLWEAIVAFFGNPQKTTNTATNAHQLASRVLGRKLSKMPGVRSIYYNRSLSTITNGQIQSGVRPDVAVVTEDDVVEPYEILSPGQTAGDMQAKYFRVPPITGSKFRLVAPDSMNIEEVMALPEAKEIAAEDAEAQAQIAEQETIAEQEMMEEAEEQIVEGTAGEE